MIIFTKDVSVNGVKPETVLAMLIVDSVLSDTENNLYITSVLDGEHMKGSLHRIGHAFDCWSALMDTEETVEAMAESIRMSLTLEYDVVVEWTSVDEKHIHVEFQPD